jgi:hypothetical protein
MVVDESGKIRKDVVLTLNIANESKGDSLSL